MNAPIGDLPTRKISIPFDVDLARQLRTGDSILLTGTLITARDAAHARISDAIVQGDPLPFDPTDQVLYFVGPTPAPPGKPIGAAGPTTASRMDPYSATHRTRPSGHDRQGPTLTDREGQHA